MASNIKGPLLGLREFLADKSPLKMMKNVIYIILNVLFVLKIRNFCLYFLIIMENDLARKLRLTSKFMTSQTGKQIITIWKLPNISRGKGNQAIKMRMRQRDQFQTTFRFKKALYKVKASGSTLGLMYFGRPPLGHTV